jgi:HEAT repeat protein
MRYPVRAEPLEADEFARIWNSFHGDISGWGVHRAINGGARTVAFLRERLPAPAPIAFEPVFAALVDPDPARRDAALATLAAHAPRHAAAFASYARTCPDPHVRRLLEDVVATCGPARYRQRMAYVLHVLRWMDHPDASALLDTLAEDPDESVADAAAAALDAAQAPLD